MLGINAQELLMATLNNSHQLLNQFNQQPQMPTAPKILFPQKQEEGAQQQQQRGQFCKYNEEQNPIVVDERQARGQRQQQREREEEEQKQQHSIKEQQKNDRRKRSELIPQNIKIKITIMRQSSCKGTIIKKVE
jgi:hypothetical protein